MAENTNEVEVKLDVEDVLPKPEAGITQVNVPTQGIVMPTASAFGQTMVNTAMTMVCGAVIGAGMNALAGAVSKGLKAGAWGKQKLSERKEKKELKAQEEKALKELKAEVTPEKAEEN